jgi:hypothetical protein
LLGKAGGEGEGLDSDALPVQLLTPIVFCCGCCCCAGKADDDGGGGGTRAVAHLLTSQLLLALRHLKRRGSLVLVLNVTPLLTYCAPLALLREYFSELVRNSPLYTRNEVIEVLPSAAHY